MKKTQTILFLVLFTLAALPAAAQFEGSIDYQVYNPQQEDDDKMNISMSITKDRLFITSNATMNVMAGLKTNGVLVRNDLQDFILMSGENEGIKVQKSELDGIVNLMNRVQGKDPNAPRAPFRWDERVVETGNSQQIDGYEAYQFILKGDEENEYVSVWLTERIKVNWGLLLDAWYDAGVGQFEQDIPIELVMNKNSFPLLVEAYKNDKPVLRAAVTSVESGNLDPSETELPSNLKLISFSEIMMNMFMQNR